MITTTHVGNHQLELCKTYVSVSGIINISATVGKIITEPVFRVEDRLMIYLQAHELFTENIR